MKTKALKELYKIVPQELHSELHKWVGTYVRTAIMSSSLPCYYDKEGDFEACKNNVLRALAREVVDIATITQEPANGATLIKARVSVLIDNPENFDHENCISKIKLLGIK